MEDVYIMSQSSLNLENLPDLIDLEDDSFSNLISDPNTGLIKQVNLGDTLITANELVLLPNKKIIEKKKKSKQNKHRISKRKMKALSGKGGDYRKNICGYVTKKIMREFVGATYSTTVQQFCHINHADYNDAKLFYSQRIQRVTGPSHIPALITPSCTEQASIMKAFISFFKWFLNERYVRHLFTEGKMEYKKAYIQYKNRELMPLIMQHEANLCKQNQNLSTILDQCISSDEQ